MVMRIEHDLLSIHLLQVAGLVRVHFNTARGGWHWGMRAEDVILLGVGVGRDILRIGGHAEVKVVGARLGGGMLLWLLVLVLLCAARHGCISIVVWYRCRVERVV